MLAARLEENSNLKKLTDLVIIVGCILAVLIALAIAYFITRMITRPVNEIKTVAQEITKGNLDVIINKYYNDEIGDLSDAFKIMSHNLNEVMTNINSSTEQVASGSRQFLTSSTASQGSAEQASSVEELTSSIEEISSQTKITLKMQSG